MSARGSIASDGRRLPVYPADVRGPLMTARRICFWLLIALWALLPWIHIAGRPAMFLDIQRRQFFLFGASFNAQDAWLLFFIATGVAFGLVYSTALLGRAWCGWACPQTVFIEAMFRPFERLIAGTREQRMRRDRGAWTFERIWRGVLLQTVYLGLSLLLSHMFISYFVSLPGLWKAMGDGPAEHPEAFAWMAALTALFYFNFGSFREQFCVVLCPYGRLQSVLLDEDSLVVGYDEIRGEPRGKKGAEGVGDCVDCRRCVVVCPTNIDIREGLQVDCIACAQCIDACDEVMVKLARPKGLIRYDSLNGLAGKPRRVLRPRVVVYTVLAALGIAAMGLAMHHRIGFEATLLRGKGAPFVTEAGVTRNTFDIHLVNKSSSVQRFTVTAEPHQAAELIVAMPEVELEGMADRRIPLIVTQAQKDYAGDFELRVHVATGAGEKETLKGKFLGSGGPR